MNNDKTFGNGYKYVPWDDREDDNTKIWHDIVRPDGTTTTVDWSPYSHMTMKQLERWVALGEPNRICGGPLNEADLSFLEWFEENKNSDVITDNFRQCYEDVHYSTGEELDFFAWCYNHYREFSRF
jgi:hypothetical protein